MSISADLQNLAQKLGKKSTKTIMGWFVPSEEEPETRGETPEELSAMVKSVKENTHDLTEEEETMLAELTEKLEKEKAKEADKKSE